MICSIFVETKNFLILTFQTIPIQFSMNYSVCKFLNFKSIHPFDLFCAEELASESVSTSSLEVYNYPSSSASLVTSDYFPFIPAISEKDIRRTYASMFINVFNSMDSVVLKDFFTTYYKPDLHLVRSCPNPQGNETTSLQQQQTSSLYIVLFSTKCDL